MGSLSNLYISQSYISLIHLGSNNTASSTPTELQDGLGNGVGVSVSTNGNLYVSGNVYATNLTGSGGSINTGSLVTTASFNAYTSSNDSKVNSLIAATASYITNSQTASMAVSSSLYSVTSSYAVFAQTASEARNVVVIARNGNQSTLNAGTVVRITGASGDNPIFNTASYTNEAQSSNTLGILRNTLASGVDGEVVVTGVVLGVNTDPTLGYVAGDVLYLSASGQFTKVQPQAPLQTVTLGEVLRAQQNNGSIYVNVSNGWELNELHNVQINTPLTNDLLAYESSSYGLWKNKSFSSLGLATTSSVNSISTSVGLLQTFSGSQYKTDSSSFDSRINAITSSGGTIYTGSFAITGSNSFRGTQTLLETGSWGGVLLNVQSGSIKFNGQVADSGFSGTGSIFLSPVNLPHGSTKVVFQTEYQSGSTTPSGYDYILGIGRQGDTTTKTVDLGTDVTLDVSRATLVGFPFTTTASFNLFSGSQYKNDSSSFDSRIDGISVDTSSLATTGSNSFTGSQTINGNIILTGSSAEIQNAKGVGIFNSLYNLDYKLAMPIQNTIGYIDELNLPHYYNGGVQPTISASATINNHHLVKVTPQQWFNLTASVGDNHTGILSVEQATGWNDINNTFGVHGNLVTSGSVNYVTQRGLSKVGIFKLGGSSVEPYIGQPIYVSDNGYELQAGYPTGSRVLRYGYVASFEQSDPMNMYVRQIYVDPVWEKGETITDLNVSSSLRVTGSLIVSGGATLIGSQWFSDAADTNSYSALSEWSGSLILSAKGYYTASFPQLTSSLANAAGTGFVNLLFKGDSTAANTILSGSSNILGNPVAPTATFYRQVGNGNLALTGYLPQVSASMLFPITMNGNTILANTGNPIIMRGPVSSSAWTINSNNILGGITIGGSTAMHAERIVNGLTVSANSVAGVLSIFANQSTLAGAASSIQQNNINGQPSLILSSSNITFTGNTINASATITNQYFSGSLGFGNPSITNSTFGGTTQNLIISGGLPSGVAQNPAIANIIMNGTTNTLYSNVAGATVSSSIVQASAIATHIFGQNLIVSASSGAGQFNTIGSAFIGRYNDISGNKAKTGETVFAVGTGNTANRKTGFLIDSGSNTFVEGTLNVSGSSSFTGSLILSSSAAVELQVIGGVEITGSVAGNITTLTVASSTASIDFNLGTFFTLTIPSSSVTYITGSNLKPGMTANIILTQESTTGSVRFENSLFKFPSGSINTGSAVASAVDMVSVMSVNSTTLYSVGANRLI